MKAAIVTDSNSGISDEEAKQLGISIIPMPVIIDGKETFEGTALKKDIFYKALKEGRNVTTSQPSCGAVLNKWDELFKEGYEEIIYIPMSSGLSGSCMTAQLLAEEYHGKVKVIDNHRISVTQRQSVLDAIRMAEKGINAQEIKESSEKSGANSIIYVGVNDLKCLKKGGRITPAAASIADFLQIKPLLIIDGGKLDAFAKIRGSRRCKEKLIEAMKKEAEKYEREGDEYYIGAASSILDPQENEEWIKMCQEAFKKEEVHYDPFPFSISTHVGINSFGMGISKKIKL